MRGFFKSLTLKIFLLSSRLVCYPTRWLRASCDVPSQGVQCSMCPRIGIKQYQRLGLRKNIFHMRKCESAHIRSSNTIGLTPVGRCRFPPGHSTQIVILWYGENGLFFRVYVEKAVRHLPDSAATLSR